MDNAKIIIQTILYSILAIGILIAGAFIVPILIGLGVVLSIYVVLRLLYEDDDH